MLTKNIINVVTPLAELLADRGITVAPNGDHELAVLNRSAMPLKESVVHDVEHLTSFVNSLPTTSDNKEHHSALISFSDQIAKLASVHMTHANSVVTPKLVEFANKLSEYQNVTLKASDPSKDFEIKCFNIPELVSYPTFTEILETNKTSVKPSTYFPAKPLSAEEVMVFLSFPDKSLNENIAKWWVNSDGYAKYVYDCFFGSGAPTGAKLLELGDVENQSDIQRLHIGILFILMGTMYQTNLPDSTSGARSMNLNQWSSLCKDYIEYGSALVNMAVRIINTAVGAKRVIMDTVKSSTGVIITVLEPVYNSWLNEGGSPEVVYGSVLSSNNVNNGKFLMDNSSQYKQEWASYSALCSARFEKSKSSMIRNHIEQLGLEVIADVSASEQDSFYKTDSYKSAATAKLKKYINEVKDIELSKVYDVSIKVVAGCGYFNTSAESIVTVIHDIGEKTPGISGKDAASIAFIDYVCRFASTLIVAKRV